MHDSVDQIHGDGSLNLLEKYLDTEDKRQAALRAAEESMMAWKVYFDGIYYEGLKRWLHAEPQPSTSEAPKKRN
jgi:hypothetical protein